MKKTLLLILGFCTLTTIGFSQKPIISAKGGFNFGKWKIDHNSSANHSRLGIQLGATAEIPFKDALTIQPELEYCMFGSIFKDSDETSKYKLNYLLLPVVAEYHFNNGISIHLGPQVGYLVSAKSNHDGEKYNFRDQMKKFDAFIVLGVEYELKNGLSVGMRIHHGLTNVEDGASTTVHNRGVSFTASYPIDGSIKEKLQNLFK